MSSKHPRRDHPPSRRRTVDAQLLNIAEDIEAVDWIEVPEVDVEEAAAFVERLERAREGL